jgi:ribosomal protein S14
MRKCLIDGCEAAPVIRGMCDTHYGQWRKGLILHPKLSEFFFVGHRNNAGSQAKKDSRPKKRCWSCGNVRAVNPFGLCDKCKRRRLQSCVDSNDIDWLTMQADDDVFGDNEDEGR